MLSDSLLQSTPGDCGPGPGSETDHTANRKRSGAPFIFPRKQRSLRRRQLLIRPSKNVVFRGS